MILIKRIVLKTYIFLILLGALSTKAQLKFDTEFGASLNTQNDIRYPNDENNTANLVDTPDQIGTGQTAFLRLRASYAISDRHTSLGVIYTQNKQKHEK